MNKARYFYNDLSAPEPNARLSVGAVVILIYNNKILFEQRSDSTEWGLIAGRMEIHESLVQAAKREVYEETSIELQLEDFNLKYICDEPTRIAHYPDGNIRKIFYQSTKCV